MSIVKRTAIGLKRNARYYVMVRTYKTVGATNYYSVWSAKKSATVK